MAENDLNQTAAAISRRGWHRDSTIIVMVVIMIGPGESQAISNRAEIVAADDQVFDPPEWLADLGLWESQVSGVTESRIAR